MPLEGWHRVLRTSTWHSDRREYTLLHSLLSWNNVIWGRCMSKALWSRFFFLLIAHWIWCIGLGEKWAHEILSLETSFLKKKKKRIHRAWGFCWMSSPFVTACTMLPFFILFVTLAVCMISPAYWQAVALFNSRGKSPHSFLLVSDDYNTCKHSP